MNKILLLSILLVFTLRTASAEEWQLAWTTTDTPSPESIVYDETRNILLVSNQHYGSKEKGDRSISLLSLNGAVIDK